MIDLNELSKTLPPASREKLEAFALRLAQDAALELQAKAEQPTVSEVEPGNSEQAINGNGKHPGGWFEIKTINGRQYKYYRWREGKTLKSKYEGRA